MIIIVLGITNIVTSCISIMILYFLYFQFKGRVKGIEAWIIFMTLLLLGFLFDISRLWFPEWIAILLSNPLQALSFICLYIGFGRFLEKPVNLKVPYLVFGSYLIVLVYFTLFDNSLVYRQFFLYLYSIYINLTISYFLLKQSTKELGKTGLFASLILFIAAIISAFGFGLNLATSNTSSYLGNNPADIFTLGSIIVITILLTYTQIMLVSARLLDNVLVSERKFSLVFDNSQLPVLITRVSDGRIYTANQSFEILFGYSLKELEGRTTLDLNLWDDPDQRQQLINEIKRDMKIKDREALFITKDGRKVVCLISCNVTRIQGDDYIINDIHDVTESVSLREELKRLATYDHLTGLANRSLFYDRFEQANALALRHQHQLSIIMMDMDDLKELNDQYGHLIGDKALVYLANQINSVLRKTDTFARFGGDEFCIILNEMNNIEGTLFVIKRIQEVQQTPMVVDGISHMVHVSMGISLFPQDGTTINELIKKADKAMYDVKSKQRNNYKFYGDLENESKK